MKEWVALKISVNSSMVHERMPPVQQVQFQHECKPVHKTQSIKTWMSEVWVGELDRPAQNPKLNPRENLWYELECRLPGFLINIHVWDEPS